MNEPCTLLRVRALLNSMGWHWKVVEYRGEKKKSIYSVNAYENGSLAIGEKRIPVKDGLMKPDSMHLDTHKLCSRYVWCLPEQESEARELVEETINDVAGRIRDEALKMFAHLKPSDEVIQQSLLSYEDALIWAVHWPKMNQVDVKSLKLTKDSNDWYKVELTPKNETDSHTLPA